MIWGKNDEQQQAARKQRKEAGRLLEITIHAQREAKFKKISHGKRVFLFLPTILDTGRRGWLRYSWRKYVAWGSRTRDVALGRLPASKENGYWTYSEE